MPEVKTRIREWKRSLAIAFGGSGEVIEELESHLREEIDRLTLAGHAPDAALAAAQAKLGLPVDLAAEYARAVPPARWLPIPVGLALLVLLFGYFSWVFVVPGFLQGGNALLGLHVATIVAGYLVGFYAGLLGICYVVCWLSRPIGLGQRRSLGQTLLLANAGAALLLLVGMVLGALFMLNLLLATWRLPPGTPAWRYLGNQLETIPLLLLFLIFFAHNAGQTMGLDKPS